MKHIIKKCMTGLVVAAIVTASVNWPAVSKAGAAQWSDSTTIFTFTDSGVSVRGTAEGYSVAGTAVTIEEAGDYVLKGECADGSVTVAKDSGAVNLYLNGLTLEAREEGTCPLNLKGGTNVITVTAVDGTVNSLSDCDHSQTSPKSVINASKAVTIKGGGTINIDANNKNGIKSDTDLTIEDDVTLNVDAVGDGIVADENLSISGGDITIKTNGGHTTVLGDDADSAKAIKSDSKITIVGGDITIDSADDAIHSGEYIYLLGGNMTIDTGDDGAHADTSLFLGSEAGGCPVIDINNCYEGLEAGTVYIYSGDIDVNSTDDGINAAGGSDSTDTDPGNFNPGGGAGGGPGGGFGGFGGGDFGGGESASTSAYSINIYGGDIYVEAEGDGVDANGDITMSGGRLVVFGAASNGWNSDNSALDYDGSCLVTGGILFAAGSNPGMESIVPSNGSQAYSVSTSTVTAGKYINVYSGSTAVFSALTPKQVAHCVYSAPTGSGWTFQTNAATAAFTCAHTNTTILNKTEATATTNSYSGDTYCLSCGALITPGSFANDATGQESGQESESEQETESGSGQETESGSGQESGSERETESGSGQETESGSGQESESGQETTPDSGHVHAYVTPVFTWSSDGTSCTARLMCSCGKSEPAACVVSSKVKTPATYTAMGVTTYTASISGTSFTDSNDVTNLAKKTLGKAKISSITTTTGGIKLSWGKVTGATGYIIYRGKSGGSLTAYKTLSSADTLTFTDTNVTNGTKYQYKVRAYVREGDAKAYGSYSAVKTRYFVSRPVIRSLTNSASKKMTVKWTKNTLATGYRIRYSTSKSFSSAKTLTLSKKTTISKVITGLTKNKTYYVKVEGYKTVNGTKYYSAWSAVKSVKIKK